MCDTFVYVVLGTEGVLIINCTRRVIMVVNKATHLKLTEGLTVVAIVTDGRQEACARRGLQQAPVCHPEIDNKHCN